MSYRLVWSPLQLDYHFYYNYYEILGGNQNIGEGKGVTITDEIINMRFSIIGGT